MDECEKGEVRLNHVCRNLTSHPHLAGTPADLEQALYLKSFWEDAGLSPVNIVPYDVLLSYPDPEKPNIIRLFDEQGEVVHQSQSEEKILRPEQDQPDVVPPYGAYSAAGEPGVRI